MSSNQNYTALARDQAKMPDLTAFAFVRLIDRTYLEVNHVVSRRLNRLYCLSQGSVGCGKFKGCFLASFRCLFRWVFESWAGTSVIFTGASPSLGGDIGGGL